MTESDFVAFEYLEQQIPKAMQNNYIDGYMNFGWQVTDRTPDIGKSTVTLKLKRDRNLPEKAALNRLQKQFEQEMAAAAGLERSKSSVPTVVAMTVGLIGTAFMAGSVFAVTNQMVVLCAILAVPTFLGWALGYFSYSWAKTRRTTKVGPVLEQSYDNAANYCQQAFHLLH
ncbi:hypothetical protein [Lacticaseibacillus daqingensis]|uniref:hypothetical protein n=1 Tax=Lacticaseibacillus daqingensis TaxID=2486014 RepID=UPI000F76C80D|nr:hypothetical protein [Lacticaseibacillus daqingensis]